MTEYEVSAVACHVAGEYEADSAEQAIEQAMSDIRSDLKTRGFELTEVEAKATGATNDWGIWEA